MKLLVAASAVMLTVGWSGYTWDQLTEVLVYHTTIRVKHMTRLEGPVESINGELMLRIPLAAGGQDLVACTRGIGHIEGEFLNILIRPWFAEKLGIAEGTFVVVDNENGNLNLFVSEQPPNQSAEHS